MILLERVLRRRFDILLGLLVLAAAGLAIPAMAGGTCTVPGSHATIQDAVDDLGCATITLAAQSYAESVQIPRSLALVGPGAGTAVVEGIVEVVGSGTLAEIQELRIESSCTQGALRVYSGAETSGSGVEAVRSSAFSCSPFAFTLFTDGFESGDTLMWSQTSP